MLAVHLYLLAVWLLLWFVFYGCGTLVCRVARCDRDDVAALLVNPWIGLAAIIGLLQIWHFIAPVSTWACGTVCAVGVLSAALLGPSRLSLIVTTARSRPAVTIVVGLLTLWLVNRSLHEQLHADHALYYLNSIRWTSDYAIVPGLGNLHIRLAFNNSNFLLHAMIEVLAGRGHSAHVLNGLMAAMTLPIVVQGLTAALRGNSDERQVGWYVLALAMLSAAGAFDGRIYSANPDFCANLLVTVAAWRLLVLSASEAESTGARLRWNLLAIALLATAAVVVKTSVIFFAALAAIVLVAILYRLNCRRESRPLMATAGSVAFLALWSMLLFVPWMGRGYIFSGYPLYPATTAGAPVDWKLDAEETARLRDRGYRVWFRTHDEKNIDSEFYQHGWAWVPEWLVQVIILRAPFDMVLPAGIAAASMLWLGYRNLVRTTRVDEPTESDARTSHWNSSAALCGWLLAAAYLGSLVPWFLTAPGPRFATFAMWGLAGVCLGLASRTVAAAWISRHLGLILGAIAIMALLPMVDQALRIEFRYRHNPKHFFFQRRFYQSYPFVLPVVPTDENGFPPLPEANLVERVTKSGLVVYLAAPKPGDEVHELVWDSPLPATQIFDPDLELRRPGDMQAGFRIAEPTAVD